MIVFKKITIEGFGSIVKPLTVNLDCPGLNLIKGKVGSGKTTLLDSIVWSLFGKKTKEYSTVESWPYIITKEYNGTKVEITFSRGEDTYTIVRCRGYKAKVFGSKGANRIILLKNGKENKTFKARLIQKEIDKILGYSYKLFKSSVIFGQRVTRFLDETPPDQKQILEEAFEISYINTALDLAKVELNKLEVESKGIQLSVIKLDAKRKSAKESLKVIKAFFKETVANRDIKVKEITRKMGLLKNLKKPIPPKIGLIEKEKSLEALELSLSQINTVEPLRIELGLLKEKLKTTNSELTQEIQKPINTTCESCKSQIDKKLVSKLRLQKKKKEEDLNNKIISLKAKIKEIENLVEKGIAKDNTSKDKIKNKIISNKEELKLLEDRWKLYNNNLLAYNVNIEKLSLLKEELEDLKKLKKPEKLKTLKKELAKYKTELKPLKENLKKLTTDINDHQMVISQVFSNKGLKNYIIDIKIKALNEALQRVTSKLDFRVKLHIDKDSSYKNLYVEITKKGKEIPKQDLSGGQTQLLNLAVAKALHDTITHQRPINLFVLDECFEGLDDEQIGILHNLFTTTDNRKAIYLVTHRSFYPSNTKLTTVKLNKEGESIFTTSS